MKKRTYDCEPTLNDTQVLEFCKNGFLMLEGVVPEEINRRAVDFLEKNTSGQPVEIFSEDWFVDNVLCNPQASGAVRSLLGKNFGLPVVMTNHRVECPAPALDWHADGNSKYGPEVDYLQVFYYPQDCPLEMGPTELLPGSHHLFPMGSHRGHYGNIRGAYRAAAPRGSIFITAYSIFHRRSASTGTGIRNNLKYNYWRTAPPQRDWIVDPKFDIATADYRLRSGLSYKHKDIYDSARMYFWLCGKSDEYRSIGGQAWPNNQNKAIDLVYGIPPGF